MVKQKKKRTKSYAGSVSSRPKITKIAAVHRSRPHQWWVDNKRVIKPAMIAAAIVFVLILVIVGIVQIIAHA